MNHPILYYHPKCTSNYVPRGHTNFNIHHNYLILLTDKNPQIYKIEPNSQMMCKTQNLQIKLKIDYRQKCTKHLQHQDNFIPNNPMVGRILNPLKITYISVTNSKNTNRKPFNMFLCSSAQNHKTFSNLCCSF